LIWFFFLDASDISGVRLFALEIGDSEIWKRFPRQKSPYEIAAGRHIENPSADQRYFCDIARKELITLFSLLHMPEKSRGRKAITKTNTAMEGPSKTVSFEADLMDLDSRFEELTKPMYKGKRIDEPIPTAVVNSAPLLSNETGQMGTITRFSQSQGLSKTAHRFFQLLC
jgi:hypothetical protein